MVHYPQYKIRCPRAETKHHQKAGQIVLLYSLHSQIQETRLPSPLLSLFSNSGFPWCNSNTSNYFTSLNGSFCDACGWWSSDTRTVTSSPKRWWRTIANFTASHKCCECQKAKSLWLRNLCLLCIRLLLINADNLTFGISDKK